MATLARKMRSKIATKTAKPVKAASVVKDEDEVIAPSVIKSKKALEVELPEEPVALSLEEKPEDEVVAPAEDADELAAEEVSLDDDELNPFGDKWEQ